MERNGATQASAAARGAHHLRAILSGRRWWATPQRILRWLVVSGAVAYMVAFGWAMANKGYNTWGPMLILPILAAITLRIAVRIARRDGDPGLVKLVLIAFALKMVGTIARYVVLFRVYDGVGDANRYHSEGSRLAESIRSFDFPLETGKVVGTHFVDLLTGIVYTITGTTKLGGFLVFSWLGFLGLWMFYRAFTTAFPDANRRWYGIVLFLFPSMLFWPSSIGKESWMMLALGMSSLGAARLLKALPGGLTVLLAGLAACSMVRPHMALIVLVSTSIAYVVKQQPGTGLKPHRRIGGLVVLFVAASFVVANVETFFGVDELSVTSVEGILDYTNEKSSQKGSEFTASGARSLANIPMAAVTVFFRPFPNEADNAQALISSTEGVVLAALVFLALRRYRRLWHLLRTEPYVLMCAVYVLMFFVAFSEVGNFGILSRQRVQVFPYLFVLLAVVRPWSGSDDPDKEHGRRSLDEAERASLRRVAASRDRELVGTSPRAIFFRPAGPAPGPILSTPPRRAAAAIAGVGVLVGLVIGSSLTGDDGAQELSLTVGDPVLLPEAVGSAQALGSLPDAPAILATVQYDNDRGTRGGNGKGGGGTGGGNGPKGRGGTGGGGGSEHASGPVQLPALNPGASAATTPPSPTTTVVQATTTVPANTTTTTTMSQTTTTMSQTTTTTMSQTTTTSPRLGFCDNPDFTIPDQYCD